MKYHFLELKSRLIYAQPKERSCQNKSKNQEIQVIPGPTNLPEITKELLALYRELRLMRRIEGWPPKHIHKKILDFVICILDRSPLQ